MDVKTSIISVSLVLAAVFARGGEVARLRAAFLEANQLEGASSNAVDKTGACFIASLGTNVFPVAETNLVHCYEEL